MVHHDGGHVGEPAPLHIGVGTQPDEGFVDTDTELDGKDAGGLVDPAGCQCRPSPGTGNALLPGRRVKAPGSVRRPGGMGVQRGAEPVVGGACGRFRRAGQLGGEFPVAVDTGIRGQQPAESAAEGGRVPRTA